MPDVLLERDGDVSLAFRGHAIAHVSSREQGKARWTEMTLWATESGHWVVERIGVSTYPNERTYRSAVVCVSPEAVVSALRKSSNGTSYLPDVALDLLEDAAAADERLRAVTVETL